MRQPHVDWVGARGYCHVASGVFAFKDEAYGPYLRTVRGHEQPRLTICATAAQPLTGVPTALGTNCQVLI